MRKGVNDAMILLKLFFYVLKISKFLRQGNGFSDGLIEK